MTPSAYITKIVLFLILIVTAMTLHAQDLQKHQWQHRILIVHTTDADSEKFVDQLQAFNGQEKGLIERKLILYKIIGNQLELLDFKNSRPLDSGTISENFIYKYLQNTNDFKIILLGLDGGIKLQQESILSIDTLFNTIDAMPMRQREMNKQ